jgi:hypothetical protein
MNTSTTTVDQSDCSAEERTIIERFAARARQATRQAADTLAHGTFIML